MVGFTCLVFWTLVLESVFWKIQCSGHMITFQEVVDTSLILWVHSHFVWYHVVWNVPYNIVSIQHSHYHFMRKRFERQPFRPTGCLVQRLTLRVMFKLDIAHFVHVIWTSDRWLPCNSALVDLVKPRPVIRMLYRVDTRNGEKKIPHEMTLSQNDGSTIISVYVSLYSGTSL